MTQGPVVRPLEASEKKSKQGISINHTLGGSVEAQASATLDTDRPGQLSAYLCCYLHTARVAHVHEQETKKYRKRLQAWLLLMR